MATTKKTTKKTAVKAAAKPAAKPAATVKKKAPAKKAVTKKAPVKKAPAKKPATSNKITVTADQHYKMVCEAAYFISLERSPETVDPEADWIQAEAAINKIYTIA